MFIISPEVGKGVVMEDKTFVGEVAKRMMQEKPIWVKYLLRYRDLMADGIDEMGVEEAYKCFHCITLGARQYFDREDVK